MDRRAVEGRRPPRHPQPTLTLDRLIDDTKHRPAVLDQRDQRAEDRAPGGEAARAVDGIEHPLPAGDAGLLAIFFADDAIARPFSVEQPAHRRLRLAVGQGDRRAVLLVLDAVGTTEIRPDRGAGNVGETGREHDVGGGNGHARLLSRAPG